jgi:hypothetical protein
LGLTMKKHYDFSKSVRNPYLSKAKKQLTIRLDEDTIEYFKALAEKNGIPYQNLMNLYLRECAESGKTLSMKWGQQHNSHSPHIALPDRRPQSVNPQRTPRLRLLRRDSQLS